MIAAKRTRHWNAAGIFVVLLSSGCSSRPNLRSAEARAWAERQRARQEEREMARAKEQHARARELAKVRERQRRSRIARATIQPVREYAQPAEPISRSVQQGYYAACVAGGLDACVSLGAMYEKGDAEQGAARDPRLAEQYYRYACGKKHATSCFRLEQLYFSGHVPDPSHSKSLAAWANACALGNATACAMAGLYIAAGRGAPPDEDTARAYFWAACQEGLDKGCDLVDRIDRGVDRSEVASPLASPFDGRVVVRMALAAPCLDADHALVLEQQLPDGG